MIVKRERREKGGRGGGMHRPRRHRTEGRDGCWAYSLSVQNILMTV